MLLNMGWLQVEGSLNRPRVKAVNVVYWSKLLTHMSATSKRSTSHERFFGIHDYVEKVVGLLAILDLKCITLHNHCDRFANDVTLPD